MSQPPIGPKNRDKIHPINWTDLSLNNPFLDPSGTISMNPLFFPLQEWKNQKKPLLLEDGERKSPDNPLRKRVKQPKTSGKNNNLFLALGGVVWPDLDGNLAEFFLGASSIRL